MAFTVWLEIEDDLYYREIGEPIRVARFDTVAEAEAFRAELECLRDMALERMKGDDNGDNA